MTDKELDWTGERLVTSVKSVGVVEHLHRYSIACEFVRDKIVLDIASGEGYGSNLLAKHAKQVIGVDVSEDAISFASNKYKRHNLIFKFGNVNKIPLENNSVDIVVSFETLEHISEQEIMLKEIKRVMKPNGLLIISTPERLNYGDINKEKNHFHVKELYYAEFEQLIKNNFKNYYFLFQKTIYGSIVVPETNQIDNYSEYWGDFNNLNSINSLIGPVFNICLASDNQLSKVNVSFFDANEYYYDQINDLQKEIKKLIRSKTFMTGRLILYPFSEIKKWFNR